MKKKLFLVLLLFCVCLYVHSQSVYTLTAEQFQNLKTELQLQESLIQNLNQNLKQAKQSLQLSENSIKQLEIQLNQALIYQNDLESQLQEAEQYLNKLKKQLKVRNVTIGIVSGGVVVATGILIYKVVKR